MSDQHPTDDPVINLIIDKIDTVEANLNLRLDATNETVTKRFDDQDLQLREIKKQTTATNGRVTVLERARAHTQGMVFAYSWVPGALFAVLSAGLTILVMALSGSLR